MINSAFFSFLVRRALTACSARFSLTRGLTTTLGPRFLAVRASKSPASAAVRERVLVSVAGDELQLIFIELLLQTWLRPFNLATYSARSAISIKASAC